MGGGACLSFITTSLSILYTFYIKLYIYFLATNRTERRKERRRGRKGEREGGGRVKANTKSKSFNLSWDGHYCDFVATWTL